MSIPLPWPLIQGQYEPDSFEDRVQQNFDKLASKALSSAALRYSTGTASGTTDGTGADTQTITHDLKVIPIVLVQPTSGLHQYTPYVTDKTDTTAVVHINTGTGFASYSVDWIAISWSVK